MGPLIFAASCLFGSVLAWRALRETCLLLILALGPLLGSAALVALSNARIAPAHSAVGLFLASVCLAALPGRTKPSWVSMSRAGAWSLAILSAVVVVYTHYHQVHVMDTDRYLHDAHIVAFGRGVYPPVNPFFPDLAMNGHFGRDLFMATLNDGANDPVGTIWWVSPFIQLAAFLTLYASTRSLTASSCRGFLVATMLFFGMDCGFRVGMIDTFEGSNGLAYPHMGLLMHLMLRILGGCSWPAWIVSGLVLGTYQLVYMTSFALLLLTGFALFLVKARTRQAWVGLILTGILSMALALTEGGAFTDLAQRGTHPELNRAVQNQGLRVTVEFPKKHLFQVLTSTGVYYRTSVAYQTSLFEGLYRPPRGDGYVNIWTTDFLRVHWLPLYLAPLALWLVRRSALGLAYWMLGAISFLLPGLFYFGPIFEAEYFRFELSAAYGFAGALGLALAEWMETCPLRFTRRPIPTLSLGPGSARYLAALAILTASLAAGEKALNDALIASGKKDFRWFPSPRQWRLQQPLFGLTEDSMAACAWLRERTQPGQQVLTNLLTDRPAGLWPDMVSATLAGVFPAGHAFPSETEGGTMGNPAFHQNSLYKAFWASADLSLLEGTRVRWLLADTAQLNPEVVEKLQQLPHQEFGAWLAVALPERAVNESGDWSLSGELTRPANETLRLGARIDWNVPISNTGPESRAILKIEGSLVEPLRFTVPTGDGESTLSLVTPLDEGTYRAVLCDARGQEKAVFELTIDFLKRLGSLRATFTFPQLKTSRIYSLQGQWDNPPAVDSKGELDLYYRFRRPDGQYAWEVDSIPQPVELDLPTQSEFALQVMTPVSPGPYELELWFFDRSSGRRVKTATAIPVAVE